MHAPSKRLFLNILTIYHRNKIQQTKWTLLSSLTQIKATTKITVYVTRNGFLTLMTRMLYDQIRSRSL